MEQTEVRERAIPADTLAARLMLARLHAGGVTIRDAAERCGLNYGSWSNWEAGMKPRDVLAVVEAISEGLQVDRDWLLFGGPLAREERRQPLKPRVLRRKGATTAPYENAPERATCVPERTATPHPTGQADQPRRSTPANSAIRRTRRTSRPRT